eukprot:GEMP01060743.1.p1 GENE.GEMP01060743.1~~GEMP01060743.1.p1  ORF type:complete len:237 (+),score=60.45 GEMP01060743.1:58-768(+)
MIEHALLFTLLHGALVLDTAPALAPAPAPAPVPMQVLPAEPTLSPQRRRNYSPVRSPLEQRHEEQGPELPPERDCMRTPALSMCGCQDMIHACQRATLNCDKMLQDSEVEMDEADRRNYALHFDHPLLNTLQMNSKSQAPSAGCQKCFQEISDTRKVDLRPLSFLEKNAPIVAKVGYRIFVESPDWESVMRGKCTIGEMSGLQDCMSYYWACDDNRERIRKWMKNMKRETDSIGLR